MKRFAVAALFAIIALVVAAPATQAKEFKYTGTQLLTTITGETPLVGDNLFLSASIYDLYWPQVGYNNLYGYLGVRWQANSWLSVAPYIGAITKFAPSGNDLALASLMVMLTPTDWLRVFLQGEVYFNNDTTDNLFYYGFYSFDYTPNTTWNFGVHCEEIDMNFQMGPHFGFTKGFWHFEVQYFATTPGSDFFYGVEGHAVRMLNSFLF